MDRRWTPSKIGGVHTFPCNLARRPIAACAKRTQIQLKCPPIEGNTIVGTTRLGTILHSSREAHRRSLFDGCA
jgi:hypothetical protein